MFNSWDKPLSNTDFISVLILSYTRPAHLLNLLRSIHKFADMPFEIIVHDDASGRETEQEIMQRCRDLCSTVVFGSPDAVNMGFAAAANRGVSLCNSEYVLLLNDDTECLAPAFQRIKRVLNVPFVGCFGPWGVSQTPIFDQKHLPVYVNGTTFHLTALPNGAGLFAFRKSQWTRVGGFPQVYTNAGDTGMMVKSLQDGSFSASTMIGLEDAFTNVDQVAGYQNPTAQKTNLDSSYPHIFRPDLVGVSSLHNASMQRKARVYDFSHENYYKDNGVCNHMWWVRMFESAREGNPDTFHWDRLPDKQNLWRPQVEEAARKFKEVWIG